MPLNINLLILCKKEVARQQRRAKLQNKKDTIQTHITIKMTMRSFLQKINPPDHLFRSRQSNQNKKEENFQMQMKKLPSQDKSQNKEQVEVKVLKFERTNLLSLT